MSAGHPVDETLFAYILDELSADDRAVIEQHLGDCALCAQVYAELQEIERASHDPATWILVDAGIVVPDPERVRDVTERVLRRDREEREAAEAMEDLRDIPLDSWEAALRFRPELRTAGMAAALLGEARRRVSAQPRESLQIVAIATSVTVRLSDDVDRLTMSGLAANERATALRHLGRHAEALAAVDEAAATLSSLHSAPDEKARVAWNRATVLWAMEHHKEARAALYEPKDWFRSIGDELDLARIGILEGSILHDEGDCAGALRIFLGVADVLEREGEQAELAVIYANTAFCHLSLGDLDAAREFGKRAMRIYENVELLSERIRTQWMFAQHLVACGNVEEGLEYLNAATLEYEAAGMIADAAKVTLERVEILLRIDAWSEAAAMARQLVTIYERTGQRISRVHALAYLRAAVDASSATPELARYVRGYIAAEVEQSFRPPAVPLPS
jgi:tetratricopeptide (TPR) repeat protein